MSMENIPGLKKEIIYTPDEKQEKNNEIENVVEDLKERGANALASWLEYLEPGSRKNLVADMSLAGHDIAILKKLNKSELNQVYLLFEKWNGVQDRSEQRKIMKEINRIAE